MQECVSFREKNIKQFKLYCKISTVLKIYVGIIFRRIHFHVSVVKKNNSGKENRKIVKGFELT